MSIQRWSAQRIAMQWHGTDLWDDEYVTYADHVAALAEAEQRGWNAGFDRSNEMAREDALQEVREAVAAVKGGYSVPLGASVGMVVDAMRWEMLAAIDALTKGEQT